MKYLIHLLLALMPCLLFAQKFHVTAFGGISSYQGDLQGKRITLSQSKPAVGLGALYEISSKFIIRTGFSYGKVEGNDSKNTTAKGIEFRNLSFKSAITEMQLGVEYNLFKLEGKSLTPYFFAAVAMYHFNPYTYDRAGNKTFLRPLSTEGQGLPQFPDSKSYSLTQFAIPFGAGLKIQLDDNWQVGFEVGLRKLFTDYLDDVSANYVDYNILLAARGPNAVELAYRGDEIANAPTYPTSGTQRGNPKTKDWYQFSGVRVSKRLNNSETRIAGKSKRLKCPVNKF
jgi:opacity protein-like surface antigen